MKVFLNGIEMQFVEGGYKYIFMKPYERYTEETVKRENGDRMHIELYDNGVQIRTLISKSEVNTIINREIAIDTLNHKIYVLEEGNEIKQNEDGSVEIIK